ncbi:mechanosensitive ion channel family protein [Flavobacterium salilacus subsp. salilacus]|uniref:mechanosensitive ion channel family protein n=1 Tax=Flavobacterium TaxID=237 RepID=UPI001074E4D5|nr:MULTISPECIES: mechanosensitive ion channel family protein [Flavobacterium]KAF2519257.1 mechanosensitive ion channel family protein [Flavobacterium salilacus subsp. salilacus]MBE1613441.1 mechanosensitive ion channel family protein [Flavobacterium sp. SaA2.13]
MNIDINNFSELITKKLGGWIEALISILPNIVLAAIILVVGLLVSKWIKKLALRFVNRVSHNITLNNLFASVIHFTFIGIVLFITLNVLKLDQTVTSILAGAGILGLALAFAFQDIAANFMSGIFISFRKPLQVGDIVTIKDYMGKVVEVNLRDTVISTFGGQTVIIPNKEVFQNPIENYSFLQKRRFDLTVGVSYGEDLERVRQITLDAVKDIEELSKTEETTFFYEEFGDSSINFSIRMWIDTAEQLVYKKVGSEAIIRIKKAYDANGIMIPFPIRTLDFGIKGGEKLSEMQVNIADGRSLDN